MQLFTFSSACASRLLLVLFLLLPTLACNHSKEGKTPTGQANVNGHQKMLNLISELQRKYNVWQNAYAAEAKLAYYNDQITKIQDPNQKLTILMKCGMTFLEYGDEQSAVRLLENLLNMAGNDKEGRKIVLLWLGTAYLRLAERENCVMGHTEDACIMPIQGKGVHQVKRGAQKAVSTFETLLKEDPGNLDARWLLNISYMTLGQYPKSVPKQWLIDGLDFVEYRINPFVDMATDLRLVTNNRAGGSIVDDFDNDGFLDIVTSAWDLTDPMHYFHNKGDGTFEDLSEKSGLKVFTGGLNIQQTDYNNDGFLDIWVLRGAWQGQEGVFGNQPNSLLRNNGNGTFTDVTVDAGLLSMHPTQTSTWNDFNNDGWLDLFVGNETISAQNPHPCELYINNQNGTFTNTAKESGMAINYFIKGVASGDYDKDGLPDIFISAMSGQKLLFRNKGGQKPVFENVTEQAGFGKVKFLSFPAWFFDYDNDGWLDIFVCNYEFDRSLSYYAAREALKPSGNVEGKPFVFRNNGNGTFTNVSSSLGKGFNKVAFAMGSNFGDFNNDGWLDIYLATGNPSYQSLVPNKMFINLEGKQFADATVSSRTGNLQKGHGVSVADLDNDGDQDIHVDMGGAYKGDAFFSNFFLNPGQSPNNRIYLKLEGVKANKAAIGAKITLKFTENGKQRMIYRECNSGGSFGSSPLRREIGLGSAKTVDELTITWPVSGLTQTFNNLEANQFLFIKEGAAAPEVKTLTPIVFKRSDGTIPMCAPVQ